jgi:hypothetical protein
MSDGAFCHYCRKPDCVCYEKAEFLDSMNKPTGTPDAPRAVDAGMEAAREWLVREYADVGGWVADGWPERMASFAAERTAALEAAFARHKAQHWGCGNCRHDPFLHHAERGDCVAGKCDCKGFVYVPLDERIELALKEVRAALTDATGGEEIDGKIQGKA